MQRTRRNLVLFCAGFLLCSTLSLWGQVGRIVGQVRVVRGDFAGRIFIELQFRGAPINSRYTDEQGRFEFDSLLDNAYRVVIRDEQFYPVDQQAIVNTSLIATTVVNIYLTPREVVQKQPPLNRNDSGNPHLVDSEEYRRRFPKKAIKEFDRGLDSERKGDREEAIRHYQKALALAPDYYPAHNNLGSSYLAKSDFKSAQGHFEQAIKLNQSDAQAHLNLANVFLMTRDFDQALKSAQEGLQREPNSAFGRFLLGSIYQHTGKFGEAENELRAALKLDPQMSRVRLELVNLYLLQQKSTEAIAELRSFLKDSPDDAFAPKAKEVLKRLEGTPAEPKR